VPTARFQTFMSALIVGIFAGIPSSAEAAEISIAIQYGRIYLPVTIAGTEHCHRPLAHLRPRTAPIDPPGRRSYTARREPVAQVVEHLTFNQGVVGSSPTGLTN
jgi:hypothetical protein